MAPPIAALPALFVSVSYRLAPSVRHPAPLHEGQDHFGANLSLGTPDSPWVQRVRALMRE